MLCLPLRGISQDNYFPSTPEEFGPAIGELFNNSGRENVMAVADGLGAIWGGLPAESKRKMMQISETIRAKKYRNVPHLSSFFRSVVYAVDFEGVDPATLTDYLNVTIKVLDQYSGERFLDYVKTMTSFFEYHAIQYSGRNRLYVHNDTYRIQFIEPEIPVVDTSWVDPNYYYDPNISYDTTSYYEEPDPLEYLKPKIEIPEPMGAIIRFPSATLNFATYYDSTFLENTSGFFSLEDHTFTGTGGTFDWSNAELEPSEVFATLKDYTFDAREAKFQALDARLTYNGRLDNPVEGIFKYESARHDSLVAARFPVFTSYKANHRVNLTEQQGVTFKGGFALDGAKISSRNLLKAPSTLEILGNPVRKSF